MAEKKTDVETRISDMEELFRYVWQRMDTDKDLFRLAGYVMTGGADNKKIEGITNITRNNPQALANNIIGKLSTSHMQIEVSGKNIKDKQANIVENFAKGLLLTVDQQLINRDISSLFFFCLQQAALRGRIGARCTIVNDPEKTGRQALVDILPMDTRYLCYITGAYGLQQFAYTTRRTKAQILQEWGQEVKDNISVVKDFWEANNNIVVIGGKPITQPTPYTYAPAVIQLTNFGLLFADQDNAKYLGESIFMSLRDTFRNLNRAASIEATIAEKAVRNATTIEGNDPNKYPALPKDDPTAYGVKTALKAGEKINVLEFADKNRSSISLDSKLSTDEQKGGTPVTSFGDRAGTESAKQVIMLNVAESRLTGPILNACSMFYERLLYMAIRQVVEQALTIVVGDIGFEEEYRWSELKGNYKIKVKFTPEDPMLTAANVTTAAEAKATGLFSDDTLRREFLKVRDPEGEKERIDNELVEKIDPILMMFRKVHALIDAERNLEAKRMAQKCIDMMGQENGFPIPVQLPPKKMTHQMFDELFEAAMMAATNPVMKLRTALGNMAGGQSGTPTPQTLPQGQPGTSGHLLPMFAGQGRQPATPETNVTNQLVQEASRNG